jgi:hypothetical protein
LVDVSPKSSGRVAETEFVVKRSRGDVRSVHAKDDPATSVDSQFLRYRAHELACETATASSWPHVETEDESVMVARRGGVDAADHLAAFFCEKRELVG